MTAKWQPGRKSNLTGRDGEGWIVDGVEIEKTEPLLPQRGSLKRAVRREVRPSGGEPDGRWSPDRQQADDDKDWTPSPDKGELGLDFEAARVIELASVDRRSRSHVEERSRGEERARARDPEISLRETASLEETARIGRRGRVRPELFVVALGALFVATALLKPWPNPPRSATSPQPTALVAVAPSGAAESTPRTSLPAPATAAPTVDIWALIPPYNYRPGQWPPPSAAAQSGGGSQPVSSAWQSVDWGFLSQSDPHTSWGVAALTMPVQPPGGQPVPAISWAKEVAPWSPSAVFVPGGSSVYGIAITWPASLWVSGVTFDYLSLAAPRVGVTPVPAAAVATPAPASSPSPTPRVRKTSSSAGLTSGAFWIAPSSDLVSPTPTALSDAWRASPWSWPIGMYRASLATNAGTMIVVLDLQQLG
jgi:hypothetical protein